MKNIFYYLSLCLFLFSCKKDTDQQATSNPSASKKFAVTFNATSFSQEVAPISKASGNRVSAVPLKGMAKYFIYVVYDESGKEVSEIRQDSSGTTRRIINDYFYPDSDVVGASKIKPYGIIKDSLPKGNYTVVMAASNTEMNLNSRYKNFEVIKFSPFKDAFLNYTRNLVSWSRSTDTFYKKFSLSIGDEPVQQNVQLERIVGKLELNILDRYVGTGTGYTVLVDNDCEAFKFSTDLPFGAAFDYEFSDFNNKGGSFDAKGNLEFFILNTRVPLTITIIYYVNGIKTYKVIDGINIFRNKKTVLSGNLFTDTKAVGFTTSVNDQFDQEDAEQSF